ncbi:MAG TPA: ABC transporter permease [Terriglobia bacterium]|nr:ABC transporter permease [Terriglobia bacterium]
MITARHNVRENLLLALDTIRSHKVRSFLTVLGVLIGTFCVIVVASVFAGLDQQFVDLAQGFGSRTLYIFKWEPGIHFGRLSKEERMRKPLTYEDGMAIKAECPSVESTAVEIFVWGPNPIVKYKDKEILDANFLGATASDFAVINDELVDGRLFTDVDDLHRRNVAVIGADVVQRFFDHVDPIGKSITVNGDPYEVIGTLAKRKAFLGDNGNDRVVKIPYFTFKKMYPNQKEHFLLAQAYEGRVDQAKEEIGNVLRRQRHVKPTDKDNFGIASADSIIQQFRQFMFMVVLVMVVISSIGLLVGGIGVMNIMLVSVTERTREIGVRKAVGARRSDISWQFLLEAMTLTGIGGTMGILGGYLVSFALHAIDWPSSVPLWAVVSGFTVAVGIGLFFGMWPAMKAARLDPIVALRYE